MSKGLSRLRRGALGLLVALALFAELGCATMGLRSAVDLRVERDKGTPGSALVSIDERFVGTLAYVERRGVRLPEGRHRISVEKSGYLPYDAILVSDREPLTLRVELVRLPD
jgi:hypothetical protein